MRRPPARRTSRTLPLGGRSLLPSVIALLAVLALLGGVAAGCGGGGQSSALDADTGDEWPLPNGNLANTRVAGGSIDSGNVEELGIAWALRITATGTFGGYASTPIVTDGVVYTQDLNSDVQAVDLDTGEVKWKAEFASPTVGPNGVTQAEGRIFGATNDFAFALDAETGEQLWRSEKLTRNDNEGIDMAPGVHDGVVYVSTVPGNPKGFYKGNGVGVLWALDAGTGEAKWSWNTVPPTLWSPEHQAINSGGGLWHAPAFDEDGDVYVSVANPGPWPGTEEFPWGSSRPGPNLYTNSLVKLDAETGEVIWHNQVLPHDVYDWDLQLSPVLTRADDRDLVIAAGKMGYVYAFDRESGQEMWRRSVGEHNGHDRDNEFALNRQYDRMPELPVTVLPGVLGGVETQLAVADGVVYAPVVNMPTTFKEDMTPELDFAKGTGEMVALDVTTGEVLWKTAFPSPTYGAATVVNDLVLTTTFDGKLLALDRDDGRIVLSRDLPAGTNATVAVAGDTLLTAASFPQSKGQVAQILAFRVGASGQPAGTTTGDEGGTGTTTRDDDGGTTTTTGDDDDAQATGRAVFASSCASCHTLAAAGASGTVGPDLDGVKPSADTVEAKVRNGGGGMPSFDGRLSDAQIAAVAAYVAESTGEGSTPGGSDLPGGSP